METFEPWAQVIAGPQLSPRGSDIREICNVKMEFSNEDWFIMSDVLPTDISYVKKELRWYLSGDRTDLSICDAASIWNNCVHKGAIQSNYGYYFYLGLVRVVELLKEDPDSRRAVININSSHHNWIGAPDVPCTMYFSFRVRNGQLDMTAHMRSQDAVFGLRNDLPAFQMFKLFAAQHVGVPPGNLCIMVDSFHVYARHWDKLNTALKEDIWLGSGFHTVADFIRWLTNAET